MHVWLFVCNDNKLCFDSFFSFVIHCIERMYVRVSSTFFWKSENELALRMKNGENRHKTTQLWSHLWPERLTVGGPYSPNFLKFFFTFKNNWNYESFSKYFKIRNKNMHFWLIRATCSIHDFTDNQNILCAMYSTYCMYKYSVEFATTWKQYATSIADTVCKYTRYLCLTSV